MRHRVTRSIAILFVAVLVLASAATAAGPSKCFSTPRVPSDYVTARVLATDVAETITAPTPTATACLRTRRVVMVQSFTGSHYYARVGGTAAAPAGDVTDGTGSALNPAVLVLPMTTGSLSVVSPDSGATTLTTEWYCQC